MIEGIIVHRGRTRGRVGRPARLRDRLVRRVGVGFRAHLRLLAERRATDAERIEHVERRAQRLVAASLALLAGYIAWDSITSLLAAERPEPSPVGIVLAAISLLVMWWLPRAKRRVGSALGSRAMTADAFQTDACFWLSLFLLVGIGANALFGFLVGGPACRRGHGGLHRPGGRRGVAGRR